MSRLTVFSRLLVNANRTTRLAKNPVITSAFLPAKRLYSDHSESFEEFTARNVKFFEQVDDSFELQRGLNNAFSFDLVPAPSVIEAALKAARRVNDFTTAVRIFEGIKDKVENPEQYNQYLEELHSLRVDLSIHTKEELGY